MRDIIRDPFLGHTKLPEAKKLAESLYRMRESGVDCEDSLSVLTALVGKSLSKCDLAMAFGSCDAQTWAQNLLLDVSQIPTDLSYEEMLELTEKVCLGDGVEFQITYWMRCLRANTGDDRLSDLIFWPGEYFGDGDDSREMSSKEILDTAIASGKRKP